MELEMTPERVRTVAEKLDSLELSEEDAAVLHAVFALAAEAINQRSPDAEGFGLSEASASPFTVTYQPQAFPPLSTGLTNVFAPTKDAFRFGWSDTSPAHTTLSYGYYGYYTTN